MIGMRKIAGNRKTSFQLLIPMEFCPVIKGYGSEFPTVPPKRGTTGRIDFLYGSLSAFLDNDQSTLPTPLHLFLESAKSHPHNQQTGKLEFFNLTRIILFS